MRKWWIVRAPNGYLCNWCILVDRTKNTKTEPKRYLCETAMSCSEWVRTTISKPLSLNALCFIIFETLLASWWNRGCCYENILRKGYVDTLLLLLSLVLILLLLLLLLPTTIIILIIMVHASRQVCQCRKFQSHHIYQVAKSCLRL